MGEPLFAYINNSTTGILHICFGVDVNCAQWDFSSSPCINEVNSFTIDPGTKRVDLSGLNAPVGAILCGAVWVGLFPSSSPLLTFNLEVYDDVEGWNLLWTGNRMITTKTLCEMTAQNPSNKSTYSIMVNNESGSDAYVCIAADPTNSCSSWTWNDNACSPQNPPFLGKQDAAVFFPADGVNIRNLGNTGSTGIIVRNNTRINSAGAVGSSVFPGLTGNTGISGPYCVGVWDDIPFPGTDSTPIDAVSFSFPTDTISGIEMNWSGTTLNSPAFYYTCTTGDTGGNTGSTGSTGSTGPTRTGNVQGKSFWQKWGLLIAVGIVFVVGVILFIIASQRHPVENWTTT